METSFEADFSMFPLSSLGSQQPQLLRWWTGDAAGCPQRRWRSPTCHGRTGHNANKKLLTGTVPVNNSNLFLKVFCQLYITASSSSTLLELDCFSFWNLADTSMYIEFSSQKNASKLRLEQHWTDGYGTFVFSNIWR